MLPNFFQVIAKINEVCNEPLILTSDGSESIIHQEACKAPKWVLYFFRMELSENTPTCAVDKEYADRGLKPLPEHILEIFAKIYPTFATGCTIATQHELQECPPEPKESTSLRVHNAAQGGALYRGIKRYSNRTVWFVGYKY